MEQYELNWKNYYEILQVSPNAELPVIIAAYRRLAQAYHPDTAKKSVASERMADINDSEPNTIAKKQKLKSQLKKKL